MHLSYEQRALLDLFRQAIACIPDTEVWETEEQRQNCIYDLGYAVEITLATIEGGKLQSEIGESSHSDTVPLRDDVAYQKRAARYPTKECRKCKQTKPREAFAHNRSTRDGLTSWCRECYNVYDRARDKRTESRLTRATIAPGIKRCEKCGEELAIEEFRTFAPSRDGHTYVCQACEYLP